MRKLLLMEEAFFSVGFDFRSIFPDNDADFSLSSESEDEIAQGYSSHQDAMVELSLSREPQSQKLGDWEKFTKVKLYIYSQLITVGFYFMLVNNHIMAYISLSLV